MASRKAKLRNDLRHRKVTVFTRPPELNVILETDQGQGLTSTDYESKSQAHTYEGNDFQDKNQTAQHHTTQTREIGTDGSSLVSECTSRAHSINHGDFIDKCGDYGLPIVKQQQQGGVAQTGDKLGQLKQYALKLNLPTRRPSYALWRQQHLGPDDTPVLHAGHLGLPEHETTWSAERQGHVDATLQAVRRDLVELQSEDQVLASRLLDLRRRIHETRMTRYAQAHRDLLEEAMFDQTHDPMDDLSDLPPRLFSPALKQYGVTRMNVQTRRFSVF